MTSLGDKRLTVTLTFDIQNLIRSSVGANGSFVRLFVRTDLVTMMSEELLEQSRWNLHRITISPYSSPGSILEVKSQRSLSHLGSSMWWQMQPCQCKSVQVPLLVLLLVTRMTIEDNSERYKTYFTRAVGVCQPVHEARVLSRVPRWHLPSARANIQCTVTSVLQTCQMHPATSIMWHTLTTNHRQRHKRHMKHQQPITKNNKPMNEYNHNKKVKVSHSRYRVLGLELIPV